MLPTVVGIRNSSLASAGERADSTSGGDMSRGQIARPRHGVHGARLVSALLMLAAALGMATRHPRNSSSGRRSS